VWLLLGILLLARLPTGKENSCCQGVGCPLRSKAAAAEHMNYCQ
jgi:hypothetical protein